MHGFLAFDPNTRIDAITALEHPYLSPYHVPEDEPSHPKLFDFSFESTTAIPEIKSNKYNQFNNIRIDLRRSAELSFRRNKR